MRVCFATSSRMHLSGASKMVRSRHAPCKSRLQAVRQFCPARLTPAAAHPRRQISSTAKTKAAMAFPRRAAICGDDLFDRPSETRCRNGLRGYVGQDGCVVKVGDYESAPDASAASWAVDGLRGFAESVLSIVPAGFEDYCRIFRPAWKGEPEMPVL